MALTKTYHQMTVLLILWAMVAIANGGDSGCGNEGTLVAAPGTLMSHPGYGQKLAPTKFCEWVITPPAGQYVSLTIEDMGNTTCHTQLFVYTHVEGDRYPGWNLCGTGSFPLDGVPYYLSSPRNEWIRVHYRGNKGKQPSTGFKATYDFHEHGCTGETRLTGAPWWLASHPGAGKWAVEAGSACTWTLTAPVGRYVALLPGKVHIHCVAGWQTLAVYDGAQVSRKNQIVLLTCTDRVSPLASSGHNMKLVYDDRWASNSLGFNISYRFYDKRQSGCGGQYLLTEASGVIYSHQPFGGSVYHPLSRCMWRVVAPPGMTVGFRFDVFDVTSRYENGRCARDFLGIREGNKNRTSAGHVFCNGQSEPPKFLVSDYHTVDLYFGTEGLSNDYGQGMGFAVKYARLCTAIPNLAQASWTSPDENGDGVANVTQGETVSYTCMDGYVHRKGDDVRVCGKDGSLSGTDIVCQARRCETIPRPTSTEIELFDMNLDGNKVFSYQEVAQYRCIPGHIATSGNARRRCMADGKVNGKDLTCEAIRCPALPVVPFSTAVAMDTNSDGTGEVSFGERVVYSCYHGYMELEGSSVRMCQADGSFSGTNLRCEPRTCGSPPTIPFTHISSVDVNKDGSQLSYLEHAQYSCLEGYQSISGDKDRTCIANGSLNGTDLVCKPKRCSPRFNVSNATRTNADENADGPDILTFGETVKFSCQQGYKRRSGSEVRVCGPEGEITGTDLQCSPIECRMLPNVAHASGIIADQNSDGVVLLTFMETVTFSCKTGYYVTEGDAERWCMEDGTWNGTHLTCHARDCPEPEVYMHSKYTLSHDTNSSSEMVEYRCIHGYRFTSGVSVILWVCNGAGAWKGPNVECVKEKTELSGQVGRPMVVVSAVTIPFLVVTLIVLLTVMAARSCRNRRRNTHSETDVMKTSTTHAPWEELPQKGLRLFTVPHVITQPSYQPHPADHGRTPEPDMKEGHLRMYKTYTVSGDQSVWNSHRYVKWPMYLYDEGNLSSDSRSVKVKRSHMSDEGSQ